MYVYFIQRESGGPIKIGKAERPEQRLVSLQVGNHEILTIRAVCLGGHAAERRLHSRFAHLLIRNEWFEPDSDLVALIARLPSWEDVKNGAFCPEIVNESDDVLGLLYDEGYTYADIAELKGTSRQRAQQLVYKAKGRIPWSKQHDYRMVDGQTQYGKPPPREKRPPRPTEPIHEAYKRLLAENSNIEFSLE